MILLLKCLLIVIVISFVVSIIIDLCKWRYLISTEMLLNDIKEVCLIVGYSAAAVALILLIVFAIFPLMV